MREAACHGDSGKPLRRHAREGVERAQDQGRGSREGRAREVHGFFVPALRASCRGMTPALPENLVSQPPLAPEPLSPVVSTEALQCI